MTRQQKTPRQRAEEALAVAERRVKRCEKRVTDTERMLREARTELVQANQRRNYAAADPALPSPDEPELVTDEASGDE